MSTWYDPMTLGRLKVELKEAQQIFYSKEAEGNKALKESLRWKINKLDEEIGERILLGEERFEYEPLIPDRECDCLVEHTTWKGETIVHEFWWEEMVIRADARQEDGGGKRGWNIRESGDEGCILEMQNNKFGNWYSIKTLFYHKKVNAVYIDYKIERELLGTVPNQVILKFNKDGSLIREKGL